MNRKIIAFKDLAMSDLDKVGGKNASLGEMIKNLTKLGVAVPDGFATTAAAYHDFLKQNGLEEKIYPLLAKLDITDLEQLKKASASIRRDILKAEFSAEFINSAKLAFAAIEQGKRHTYAVRSSATAEDLPDASFAGQQDSFLNVANFANILMAIKHVYASLFNERAISYRAHRKFKHEKVAISAGVQRMAHSTTGSSGVMFTLDTESGFEGVVFINANYGLGETVVRGLVNPDEFYVFKKSLEKNCAAIVERHCGSKKIKMVYAAGSKIGSTTKLVSVEQKDRERFSLNDADVMQLSRYAMLIEKHYKMPMDIEWAKDGVDGKLYILQARPETVRSRDDKEVITRFSLDKKGKPLVSGFSVGQKIGAGSARIILSASKMHELLPDEVLITDMTDPDWEPVMKRAAAIVTNRGGRTCHAAIVARELGIPAIVGAHNATKIIKDGAGVTVSCAEGATGFVYPGILPIKKDVLAIDKMPALPVKLALNLANPKKAFDYQFLPNAGVGLARLEFIINDMIGMHPRAALDFATLPQALRKKIQKKTFAYGSPVDFYVERLKEGVATIAAAFYPKPVIVRFSDFKSNEYANLLGGSLYEPQEENPMIGWRGVSRYIAKEFRDCFALECVAIKKVREEMGLTNVEIMLPFLRTLNEAKEVTKILAENGLTRGEHGLRAIMMCEIPANAILAEEFLEYFDGFSIGSNDLTQLTLGIDRDSSLLGSSFDERDPAVKFLLERVIKTCNRLNKYIGICGQGPSDHPDFAEWLQKTGIQAISLNPDTVVATWLKLAKNSG